MQMFDIYTVSPILFGGMNYWKPIAAAIYDIYYIYIDLNSTVPSVPKPTRK